MTGIGNFLDNLMSKFSQAAKKKTGEIDRDTLRQSVEDSLGVHQCLVEVLTSVDSKRLKEWIQTQVDQALRSENSASKDAYYTYVRSLDNKYKRIETETPFGSLIEVNKIYVTFLTEVLKNFDTLVEKQTLTIYDFKLSLAGLCSYLDKSRLICDFSSFLFAYLVRTAGGIGKDIPKYRALFLVENAEKVASLVSEITSNKNELRFVRDVKDARTKFADFEFSQNGQFTSDKARFIESQASKNGFAVTTLATAAFTIGSLLSILGTGYLINNYNKFFIWNHNRKKETREWLQQHVALLRLELAELDPSSPEFAKLEAIIKAYDDDIADYDKDIAEFEAEVLNA